MQATTLQEEVDTSVSSLTKSLPASEQQLEEYCKAQEQNEECSQVLVAPFPVFSLLHTLYNYARVEKSVASHLATTWILQCFLHSQMTRVNLLQCYTATTLGQLYVSCTTVDCCKLSSALKPSSMEKDEGVRAASSASPCCNTLITSDSPKYDPWQVVGTDLTS